MKWDANVRRYNVLNYIVNVLQMEKHAEKIAFAKIV